MTLANIPNAILVIEAAFKAEIRPLPIVIARSLALLTSAAIKIALCMSHVSISYIGAATAVEALVLGLALIATYQASGHHIAKWRIDRHRILFLCRQCLPAMASAVVVMLFFRINHLLLAGISTFDEVGRYALAFSIIQMLALLPWAAATSLYPSLVRLHETDHVAFRQNVAWMFWIFSLLGYLATASARAHSAIYRTHAQRQISRRKCGVDSHVVEHRIHIFRDSARAGHQHYKRDALAFNRGAHRIGGPFADQHGADPKMGGYRRRDRRDGGVFRLWNCDDHFLAASSLDSRFATPCFSTVAAAATDFSARIRWIGKRRPSYCPVAGGFGSVKSAFAPRWDFL